MDQANQKRVWFAHDDYAVSSEEESKGLDSHLY